ncbi:MAG: efflux RND transporter periplasmic adaptor subunit [Burkholderiaceae bacterium]
MTAACSRLRRPDRSICHRQRQSGRARVTPLVALVALIAIAVAVGAAWYAGGFGPRDGASSPPGSNGTGATPGSHATNAAPGSNARIATPGPAGVTPAMTITVVRPQRVRWSITLPAQGSIAAWQEAAIGAEVSGMRIAEVRANVGDRVERGDVLATLAPTTLANELAQQQATLAEARAALAEARANAERARKLQDSGAISVQQVNQYLTAEQTARARVQAVDARIRTDRLRLSQAEVRAPDNGVVSARIATPGAVAQAGQELFRLIRDGRLEWRAEVPAADLGRLHAGTAATITLPDGSAAQGRVRVIGPTVDPQTRNGLVYVDLDEAGPSTSGGGARAGMFARGSFELGRTEALTVPTPAVAIRDGFSHVFRVGADGKVTLVRVVTGRRQDDRVEIVEGIDDGDTVAESGVGFLADGDFVAIVPSPDRPAAAN